MGTILNSALFLFYLHSLRCNAVFRTSNASRPIVLWNKTYRNFIIICARSEIVKVMFCAAWLFDDGLTWLWQQQWNIDMCICGSDFIYIMCACVFERVEKCDAVYVCRNDLFLHVCDSCALTDSIFQRRWALQRHVFHGMHFELCFHIFAWAMFLF